MNRVQRTAAVSAARQLMQRDRLRFGKPRGPLRQYIAFARALAEAPLDNDTVVNPSVMSDKPNDGEMT